MSMSRALYTAKNECRWSLIVWLACLALVVLLSSCAHPNVHSQTVGCNEPSQVMDWYEIGRRDGATGARLAVFGDYQKQCPRANARPDSELYTNGRNAGLVEYCTAQVGLEAARFGRTYAGVCPTHMEKSFLKGYQAGQKIRALETENHALELQIATLARVVLDARDPASTNNSAGDRAKLAALRKKHAANEATIGDFEQSVQIP